MTQQDLAKKARISVSFLSMIEHGLRAPHLATLVSLAEGLQVPITELFSHDANPDQVDTLYRPLIDFCRTKAMTKHDVQRLISVARSIHS